MAVVAVGGGRPGSRSVRERSDARHNRARRPEPSRWTRRDVNSDVPGEHYTRERISTRSRRAGGWAGGLAGVIVYDVIATTTMMMMFDSTNKFPNPRVDIPARHRRRRVIVLAKRNKNAHFYIFYLPRIDSTVARLPKRSLREFRRVFVFRTYEFVSSGSQRKNEKKNNKKTTTFIVDVKNDGTHECILL